MVYAPHIVTLWTLDCPRAMLCYSTDCAAHGLFAARPKACDIMLRGDRENTATTKTLQAHTPDGMAHVAACERLMTMRPHDARLASETAGKLIPADC